MVHEMQRIYVAKILIFYDFARHTILADLAFVTFYLSIHNLVSDIIAKYDKCHIIYRVDIQVF